jgi:ABC-2 type transport system ATP-binding protein
LYERASHTAPIGDDRPDKSAKLKKTLVTIITKFKIFCCAVAMFKIYDRKACYLQMIEVNELTKKYGDFLAVKGISFDVHPGEIFGLLGPNGAGKTTTLECMEGLLQPTAGSILIDHVDPGAEPGKLRNVMGVQLQTGSLPEYITIGEAMKVFCAYHEVAPRMDLLNLLGLEGKQNNQFFELSAGQQRRLALALAVAHNPKVVFLDEPTAGLDVAARIRLHEVIRELKAGGATILMATHDMAEAEELCDRVAILLSGELVTVGTPLQITAKGSKHSKISIRTKYGKLSDGRISLPAAIQVNAIDGYGIFYSSNVRSTIGAILSQIDTMEDELIDLRVERPSLEDRFLDITSTDRLLKEEQA